MIIGLTGWLFTPPARAGAIIVAKISPIQSVKSTDLLRLIFLGETRSLDGRRLTVVLQQPGAETTEFDSAVMKEETNQLTIDRTRLIFTGEVAPPMTATDSAGVKTMVLSVPGAIGYVSDDAVDPSVKVIYRY